MVQACHLCGHEHGGDHLITSDDHLWDRDEQRRTAIQAALDAAEAVKREIDRLLQRPRSA
jgi:hypothetical protein